MTVNLPEPMKAVGSAIIEMDEFHFVLALRHGKKAMPND
jgi:hypothetical protein